LTCAAFLVPNVSSVNGRSKNIGSLSGHIGLACLACFGKLLIVPASLLCCVNVATTNVLAEVDFL
jgi:hypothetical protein